MRCSSNSSPPLTNDRMARLRSAPFPLSSALIGTLALVGLAIVIAFSRHSPVGDEAWYLNTVPALFRKGLTLDFLRSLPGPAGPLYTFVQALAWPLTGGQAHLARWVSWVFLLLSIFYLAGAWQSAGRPQSWGAAALIAAVPVVQSAGGTALTDMPAFLPFCANLFFLTQAISVPPARKIRYALLAGLALGIAAAGRQQALGFLLATPLLLSRRALGWTPTAGYLAAAGVIPLFLFAVWGGLVPPTTGYVSGGISFFYGFCGLGYAGIFYFLFHPHAIVHRPVWFLALFIGSLGWIWGYESSLGALPIHLFWKSGFESRLSASLAYGLARIFQAALFAVGFRFLLDLIWRRQEVAPVDRIYTLGAVGIVATCFKISHQFSNRYVLMCVPLFLLSTGGRGSVIRTMLFVIAAVAGLRSLALFLGVFG